MTNKTYLDIISNGIYDYLNWYQKMCMFIICIPKKKNFVKRWNYITKEIYDFEKRVAIIDSTNKDENNENI